MTVGGGGQKNYLNFSFLTPIIYSNLISQGKITLLLGCSSLSFGFVYTVCSKGIQRMGFTEKTRADYASRKY